MHSDGFVEGMWLSTVGLFIVLYILDRMGKGIGSISVKKSRPSRISSIRSADFVAFGIISVVLILVSLVFVFFATVNGWI